MKKMLGVSIALSLTLVLMIMSCASPTDDLAGSLNQIDARAIVTDADRDAAVDVVSELNITRKNASGPKIPSNAHSKDFPGVIFCWDSKQKDDGVLKVEAAILDQMAFGFVLTAKLSNEYWDYLIVKQDDQKVTEDGYYVFNITKTNGKNINMVFIPEVFLQGLTNDVDDVIVLNAENANIATNYFVTMTKKVAGKDFADWQDDAQYFSFDIDGIEGDLEGDVVTFAVAENNSFNVTETITGTNKYYPAESQAVETSYSETSLAFTKTITGDSITYKVIFEVIGEIVSGLDGLVYTVTDNVYEIVYTGTDSVEIDLNVTMKKEYADVVNVFVNTLKPICKGDDCDNPVDNEDGYCCDNCKPKTPTTPPANKGCENCQGNNAANRCDGRGCAGNGKGPAGGSQGNDNQQ